MPNRIMKTNFVDAYDLRIKKQYLDSEKQKAAAEHEQFYKTETIETEDTRWSYITGFGLWQQKGFGANVANDTVYQAFDTICTPATYALYFQIEEETVEDDPTGILSGKLAAALSDAGDETMEVLAAQPFNNAGNAAYASPWMTGGDGVALLSTAHPLPAGGTWSNTPAVAADLSIASLQAGQTSLKTQVNARGQVRGVPGKTLVVAPAKEWLMREILETPQTPYNADNTKNVVRDGITGQTWSRLTDTDCWFLLADKAGDVGQRGHHMTKVVRIKKQFDRDTAFLSGDRQYKGRMRIGFCNPDPRGIYGSMGTP